MADASLARRGSYHRHHLVSGAAQDVVLHNGLPQLADADIHCEHHGVVDLWAYAACSDLVMKFAVAAAQNTGLSGFCTDDAKAG